MRLRLRTAAAAAAAAASEPPRAPLDSRSATPPTRLELAQARPPAPRVRARLRLRLRLAQILALRLRLRARARLRLRPAPAPARAGARAPRRRSAAQPPPPRHGRGPSRGARAAARASSRRRAAPSPRNILRDAGATTSSPLLAAARRPPRAAGHAVRACRRSAPLRRLVLAQPRRAGDERVENAFESVRAYYSIPLVELVASRRAGCGARPAVPRRARSRRRAAAGCARARHRRMRRTVCKHVRREILLLVIEPPLRARALLLPHFHAVARRRRAAAGPSFRSRAHRHAAQREGLLLPQQPRLPHGAPRVPTCRSRRCSSSLARKSRALQPDVMVDHQYGGAWATASPMYREDWFGTLDNGPDDAYALALVDRPRRSDRGSTPPSPRTRRGRRTAEHATPVNATTARASSWRRRLRLKRLDVRAQRREQHVAAACTAEHRVSTAGAMCSARTASAG